MGSAEEEGCAKERAEPKIERAWDPLAFGAMPKPDAPDAPVVHGSVHALSSQVRKNSLNIKFLGGIFLGHPGPRRRDIPDKNFMQVASFLDSEGPGCPGFGKTLCKKTLG